MGECFRPRSLGVIRPRTSPWSAPERQACRPLVDSRGRVIGINTAMIFMAQGISFAVPVSTARWVVGELVTNGKVRRAYLGIGGQARPISRRVQRSVESSAATAVDVGSA